MKHLLYHYCEAVKEPHRSDMVQNFGTQYPMEMAEI